MTAVEAAVTFAIVGSLLAVAVPALVRNLRSSKLVEPVDGVKAIAEAANAFAQTRDVAHAYPPSAPLTPASVPKGTREVDPPGAWDHPTWRALDFRAAPEGIAHAFSFAFDSAGGPARSTFAARAHGDLDGDGVLSTFEVRGHDAAPLPPDGGTPSAQVVSAQAATAQAASAQAVSEVGPVIEPGMIVEAEVE